MNKHSGTDKRHADLLRGRSGAPQYAGILIFVCSVLLSSQFLWAIRHHPDDLWVRASAAIALGFAGTALTVAIVRRLLRRNAHDTLQRLSLALAPGLLIVFAPFRYEQLCRWTDHCFYWTDVFIWLSITLIVVIALYEWSESIRRSVEKVTTLSERWLARSSSTRRFWVVALSCFALLAWRGWGRLMQPELFAEGGSRFVADALNHGWRSLLFDYAGYYHSAPRLLALLGTSLVPVPQIPAFTGIGCFAAAAGVCAFIARPCFRWLIPSDAVRIAAALLLCLAPGLNEVLGNLPNLHYLFLLFIGLLTFKDPGQRYRAWELGLALLAVLTTGAAVIWAPAAIVRLWIKARLKKTNADAPRPKTWDRDLALLGIIAIGMMLTLAGMLGGAEPGLNRPENIVGEGVDPLALARSAAKVIAVFFLLHPFAGTVAVTEIVQWIPALALAIGAMAVLGQLMRSHLAADRHAAVLHISAWLTGPLALLALIGIMRPVGLEVFASEDHWQVFGWWMRYNYVFAASGLLLWLMLLRPTALLPARRLGNVFALTILCAYASQANWYFEIGPYGKERRWARSSATLEQAVRTGCPRIVRAAIYPNGWAVTYRARIPNPSCEE